MHLNKLLEQIKRHQSPTEAIEMLSKLLVTVAAQLNVQLIQLI